MKQLALIIEDDAPLHLIYRMVLAELGFETLHAHDGQEALDILAVETPQIIFLDILLPVVNGKQVMDYLKQTPRLQHNHAVIVSAHDRFAQQDILRPQDAFLLKPIRPDDIRQVVKSIITMM